MQRHVLSAKRLRVAALVGVLGCARNVASVPHVDPLAPDAPASATIPVVMTPNRPKLTPPVHYPWNAPDTSRPISARGTVPSWRVVFYGGAPDADDYVVGLDDEVKHEGRATGFLRALDPTPRGMVSLDRSLPAARYRGMRLRLSASIKADHVDHGTFTSSVRGRCNGDLRELRGTGDWTLYELLVEVDPDAVTLDVAIELEGGGQLWVDGLRVDIVGPVPHRTETAVPCVLDDEIPY